MKIEFYKGPALQRCASLIALIMLNLLATVTASAEPWRLTNAVDLPDWLSVSGGTQIRYETLDEQFRSGRNGDDQILAYRTTLLLEASLTSWRFAFEILDARQAFADESTLINTTIVNPFDVLQAYAQFNTNDFLFTDSVSAFKAGRFTMDIGSRRLVARNVFRNTINAFTGVDWTLSRADNEQFRAFFTLPVNRLPNDPERLLDNETKGDDQDTEVKFWGLHYKLPTQSLAEIQSEAEVYYFGLNENDSHNRNTRNRELQTIGGKIFKSPQKNQFDYEIESAIQFGESRSTAAATNRENLDHFAQFYYTALGYSFDYAWSPRLIAEFDFASGDDDPDDGDNNRFDSLFGFNREYGPIGIWGAFVRSNLISPALRLQLKPANDIKMFIAYRGVWLASKRDALSSTGVRDATGSSGSFVGQQLETRIRWNIYPENLLLEVGGTYLFKGEFLEDAPNATGAGDPNYWYSQVVYKF
jgi:hypothetical protein